MTDKGLRIIIIRNDKIIIIQAKHQEQCINILNFLQFANEASKIPNADKIQLTTIIAKTAVKKRFIILETSAKLSID